MEGCFEAGNIEKCCAPKTNFPRTSKTLSAPFYQKPSKKENIPPWLLNLSINNH